MTKVEHMNRMFERCPKLANEGLKISKKSVTKFERKIPEGIKVIEVD
jgi:hypothetical protein